MMVVGPNYTWTVGRGHDPQGSLGHRGSRLCSVCCEIASASSLLDPSPEGLKTGAVDAMTTAANPQAPIVHNSCSVSSHLHEFVPGVRFDFILISFGLPHDQCLLAHREATR